MLTAWREKVAALKRYVGALYFALRDPRVPRISKLIITVAVAYALSPVDLIPDFIPLVGWLDELVVLPVLLSLAVRLMPEEVWSDCENQAAARPALPPNQRAAWVVRTIWLFASVVICVWLARLWIASGS